MSLLNIRNRNQKYFRVTTSSQLENAIAMTTRAELVINCKIDDDDEEGKETK